MKNSAWVLSKGFSVSDVMRSPEASEEQLIEWSIIDKQDEPSRLSANERQLEMLKKLTASQELLLRKEQELSGSNFDEKLVKKIQKNIWIPSNISNLLETTSELEKLEPVLEFVDKEINFMSTIVKLLRIIR